MPSPQPIPPSKIILEEYFASEDERFLVAFARFDSPEFLKLFAERWWRDERPWARKIMLDYLGRPMGNPGHEVVVKRLFKAAEAAKDHAVMATFLVALDCHVRRVRVERMVWDFPTRTSFMDETLRSPLNTILRPRVMEYRNPRNGKVTRTAIPGWVPKNGRLFSYRTRYYLRRRAWRYFRLLGYREPGEYLPAIAGALRLYRDADLKRGENLLDSWGLMHACFGKHPAIEHGRFRVYLKDGRALSELKAAPWFPLAWQCPEGAGIALDLVFSAESQLVRGWAREMFQNLRQTHPLRLTLADWERLLRHPDPDVQALGVDLLSTAPDAAHWPLDTWLGLLRLSQPGTLAAIAAAFQRHVADSRLDVAGLLALACHPAAPVAQLGLDFLRGRPALTPAELRSLAAMGEAKCLTLGLDLASCVLEKWDAAGIYDPDLVTHFFDSLNQQVRQAAWTWLFRKDCPGDADPVLWTRLVESPFDDVRLRLIQALERKSAAPVGGPEMLIPLWSSVLLGVHRGGRQKSRAVSQLAAAMEVDFTLFDRLMPVLVAAIRSVRKPESRAGLAAVVGLLERHPELATRVAGYLPELGVMGREAA